MNHDRRVELAAKFVSDQLIQTEDTPIASVVIASILSVLAVPIYLMFILLAGLGGAIALVGFIAGRSEDL